MNISNYSPSIIQVNLYKVLY